MNTTEAGDGMLDVMPNIHGDMIHQVGSILVALEGIMSSITHDLIAIISKEGWPI